MTRTSINFGIDIISLLVMVALITTGCLIYFVLPPGTGHTHLLLGLGRHDFGKIHFYLAVAAIVLLAFHVVLRWNWICCVVSKAFGKNLPSRRMQTTWGLAFLGGLFIFFGAGMWWASYKVEPNITPGRNRGRRLNMPIQQETDSSYSGTSNSKSVATQNKTNMQDCATQACVIPVTPPLSRGAPSAREKHLEECAAGAAINGSITLIEASRICGLKVEQMKEYLNLPFNVDSGERLGRIKRRYGVSLYDVRKLACRD